MNLVAIERIHTELFKRWKELDLRPTDIIKDATERGLKGLTPSRLSKYKNRSSKETISDEQLRWLLVRYGIPFSWALGKPQLEKNKLVWVIPPYSELQCLQNIQKMFGGEQTVKFTEVKPKKKKNGKEK